MTIEILSTTLINQIAAGEVIDRPASVVKELMENAIDAGSNRIQVLISNGGKSLIRVIDNGSGIPKEELRLALQRHATSKIRLPRDLEQISTLGFRGEGLASIESISRLRLSSRPSNQDHGWEMIAQESPKPCALNAGTDVEIRDLFYNVPARQKFLRSNTSEVMAIVDVFQRLALTYYGLGFRLVVEGKERYHLTPAATLLERIEALLGKPFVENSSTIDGTWQDYKCKGMIGRPHFHHVNGRQQYIFVNSRSIRDKIVQSIVNQLYRDVIPKGRYGRYILFLQVPTKNVDVNVHPTKLEVRFRFPQDIRSLLNHTLHSAISTRQSTHDARDQSYAFSGKSAGSEKRYTGSVASTLSAKMADILERPRQAPPRPTFLNVASNETMLEGQDKSNVQSKTPVDLSLSYIVPWDKEQPLGQARSQIALTYILAESEDGLVLVDQHAAHERIVYEKFKQQLETKGGIQSQALLTPLNLTLTPDECDLLLSHKDALGLLGCGIEAGPPPGGLVIRSVPSLLAENLETEALFQDIIAELTNHGETHALQERLWVVCAKRACYGSIRAGRKMEIEEMNALLRQMESIPNGEVCNHGRPTQIFLSKKVLESLFHRR